MAQPAFLRARRPEHKRQRREAILDAARELALRSGVRNVSLGDVGAAVGLAKSAVVRYFATREEIYLEITAESWRDWAEDTTARLRAATGLEQVVDALVEPLAARPLFCDLLGQTPISLEHNISVEVALDFKRTVLRTVGEVAAELTAAHPVLTGEEGFELVGAACALAGTLHPMAHPPAVMAQIYAEHPDLAVTCPEFAPTLRRTLTALALGLPALRTPEPAGPPAS